MKKHILLTGATGTVGKEALKQLCEKSQYDISVLGRDSSRNRKILEPYLDKITLIGIDLSKPNQIGKLEGSYDVVIHLAAVIPPIADEELMAIYRTLK